MMFDIDKLGDQEAVDKAVKEFFGDKLFSIEELEKSYPNIESEFEVVKENKLLEKK